jgi:hypothetical protein
VFGKKGKEKKKTPSKKRFLEVGGKVGKILLQPLA